MKITLFFSALWIAIASFFAPAEQTFLSGKVIGSDNNPLIGASVAILKDRAMVKGGIADVEGRYKIEVAPGMYDVEVSYVGYASKRLTEVNVEAGKNNELNIVLEGGSTLSEVVITDLKRGSNRDLDRAVAYESVSVGRISKAKSGMGKAPTPKSAPDTGETMRTEPAAYSAPAGEARPMPTAPPPPSGEIGLSGKKSKPADYHAPSGDDKATKAPTEKAILIDSEDGRIYEEFSKEMKDEAAPGTIPQPTPRAGLLTAGEWNDLHNWNRHWTDLLADGEIASYETMYAFFAHQRFTVMLTNDLDIPLADIVVQLKNASEIIWEARTDNTGKAELWAGLYDKKEFSNLTLEAWLNGKKYDIGKPKTAKEGFNVLKINTPCAAPNNVDIVWAVDATGSMGDEIEYLKTEVLDVIARAKNNNPALSFRMGTAFYRDKGDEYIVKSSGLSLDINRTVEFIQKQSAGGGGDYPEAVHSALEEVVYGQKWSENAIARICFLVLDASPHQNPEVIASLHKTIKEAAKLGIRIVPLAASGIQKDTEFLMKFFGLATNGTYLFLTDHSGIGGKHLEPTTDEYKVEPLNDLLVRIITEYTSIQTCEGKSNIRFEDDPQQQPGATFQATYYPNPAADQFSIELPFEVQSITLYDSEGKGVRKVEKPLAGVNVIPVRDLAPGYYTIRILNNGRMQSGKLMVVR